LILSPYYKKGGIVLNIDKNLTQRIFGKRGFEVIFKETLIIFKPLKKEESEIKISKRAFLALLTMFR